MNYRLVLKRAVLAVLLIAVGFVGWTGIQLWRAWSSFEHVDFDLDASRAALESLSPTPTATSTTSTTSTLPADPDAPEPEPSMVEVLLTDPSAADVFLLVGSDEDKPRADSLRADSILVFVWPEDGSPPLLASLPRDLYVANPCTGTSVRINTTLLGCGGAVSGPELLALTVEDFTGLVVDHFVVISFGGFEAIVDEVGGVEVCVENPTRFGRRLELDAGCSTISGAEALAWLRERAPLELVDGEWVALQGGDLSRIDRQQALMVEMLRGLRKLNSPLELNDVVSGLADAFILDEGLNLPQAIDTAWDLRRVRPQSITRKTIAVESLVTDAGEFALRATESFADLLGSVYDVG